MVSCEWACTNLISKANFNLINRTDLLICLHIMFEISFQNSKGQKSYRKFLGVRSELLLSICFSYFCSKLLLVRTRLGTRPASVLKTKPTMFVLIKKFEKYHHQSSEPRCEKTGLRSF